MLTMMQHLDKELLQMSNKMMTYNECRRFIDKNHPWFAYANTFSKFVHDVHEEQERARRKFPEGDRLLGAVMEEVGEVAQALLKIKEAGLSPENVYLECVQAASTLYRLASEGEPEYGYEGMKCAYNGCKQPTTGGPCHLCYE